MFTRRQFLGTVGAATACAFVPSRAQTSSRPILGQGEFRYRVVPNWGILGAATPVKDCHGLVCDRAGHVILLTNHTDNNIIIYDRAGRLVHKWGHAFVRAHGLSIVTEGDREVLFITDLTTNVVCKTTLDGTILEEWRWPESSGKYEKQAQYLPTWTVHLPNGEFYVLDGYGLGYITHYGTEGKFIRCFGGPEGGVARRGPHGGMLDHPTSADPTLLLAMSDRKNLLRVGLDGTVRGQIDLPGGNPRQIRRHGDHYFVTHLADKDNWQKDTSIRGFVSVLDANLKVVSNVAGAPPVYNNAGVLQPMAHQEDVFMHPHDLIVDQEQSLYVAQYGSNQTYPIKLERV